MIFFGLGCLDPQVEAICISVKGPAANEQWQVEDNGGASQVKRPIKSPVVLAELFVISVKRCILSPWKSNLARKNFRGVLFGVSLMSIADTSVHRRGKDPTRISVVEQVSLPILGQ